MDQGHSRARENRHVRWGFKALAVGVVGALMALSLPGTAQAAAPVSQGEGRLLTAFIGGSVLDSLAALNGASAIDSAGLGDVVSDVPLNATALGLLNISVPATVPGVTVFGSPGIIQLGAVGQYAGANDDGSSVAFSGAVSQAPSLVGAGTTVTGSNVGTPGAGDSATINVGTAQILGGANLVGLSVDVGALAASANETAAGVQTGDYVLSSLNVGVGGTLLGTTITTLNAALDPTLAALNVLIAPDIVNPLEGGQVTISLADLLAVAGVPNVNALPEGTNLLTFLPAAVTAKVTSIVNNLLGSMQTAVTGLGLGGVAVQALLTTATGVVTPILSGLTGALNGPLGTAVNALLQLDVNNKSTIGGAFTQNALTIGVGTNGSLVRVPLANATVGPNGGPPAPAPVITGMTPITGPESGGTPVTITGTGFTGSTGVTFDGLPATSFVVVSDTEITAVSPAHVPGPVDVVVQNPAGDSGPFGFTYTPVISIAGIAPNSGPTAGGTSVTITGTCFTGATGVTFAGVAGTAFTVVDDTHITVTSPAHAAGAVDVVVTGSVACGGNSTLTNGFTYIAPGGPVALSLTPDSGPASGGTSVTITGTNLTGATGVTFDGIAGTNFVAVNSTTVTVTTPSHAIGDADVVVQTPLGPSGPLAFTFLPTTVIAVAPGSGVVTGGTAVTITGACFTGATGVLFGATPATSFNVVNDTSIVAVSPPGTGVVDVTVIGSPTCGDGTLASAFRYTPVVLAFTGAEALPLLIAGLLLLLSGFGIVWMRRRRNKIAA